MAIKIIDKDLGWKEIKKDILNLKGIKIKVGLWGNGSPEVNMAYRGAVHQYGVAELNIPRRPFMSNAFDDGLKNLTNLIINEYGKVLDKRQGFGRMVDRIGVFHEGQIKDKIIEGNFQALKRKTIIAKGSTAPLIDTATMKNSITFKIEKGL